MAEVELRPFERADIPRLLGWVSSRDDLIRWAGSSFLWPLDEQQLQEYLASASDDHLIFKVQEQASGEVVGHLDVIVNRDHRFGLVNRVLVAPSARGRGVCTAAMRVLVHLAFGELKLHRLSLSVFDSNAAAISCYESVGFIREGHLRDSAKAGDGYWSSIVMGLLESDVGEPSVANRHFTSSL